MPPDTACVKCETYIPIPPNVTVVRCPECGTRNAVGTSRVEPLPRKPRLGPSTAVVIGAVVVSLALIVAFTTVAIVLIAAGRQPEVVAVTPTTTQSKAAQPQVTGAGGAAPFPRQSQPTPQPAVPPRGTRPTKPQEPPVAVAPPSSPAAGPGGPGGQIQQNPKQEPDQRVKLQDLPVVYSYPRPADRPTKEVFAGYYKRSAGKFTMYVSEEAHEQSDKLDGQPIGCLESELQTISERLPESVVKQLAKVPVWVEWDHIIPGHPNVLAVYHGTEGEALLLKGVDPRKSQCVTVTTLKRVYLLKSRDMFRTTVLMHELAHAVHDQVFGFDDPVVINAYKQAMTRKLYATVKQDDGEVRAGYAVTNAAEYFAELSTCYLDRLPYFPTDAAGLREYDSPGYELMTKVWGTEKAIEAAKKADAERKEKLKKADAKKSEPPPKPAPGRAVTLRPPKFGNIPLADSVYVMNAITRDPSDTSRWEKNGAVRLLTESTEVEVLGPAKNNPEYTRIRLKEKEWLMQTSLVPEEKK